MRTPPYFFARANLHTKRGFVALVSALIFSLLLMLLVLSEGTAAFWTRADQTDQEQASASRTLAESCMYEALLDYAEDSGSLATSIVVPIDPDDTCTIEPTRSNGSVVTFTTQATSGSIPTFLVVTASTNTGTLAVTSWHTATSIPP